MESQIPKSIEQLIESAKEQVASECHLSAEDLERSQALIDEYAGIAHILANDNKFSFLSKNTADIRDEQLLIKHFEALAVQFFLDGLVHAIDVAYKSNLGKDGTKQVLQNVAMNLYEEAEKQVITCSSGETSDMAEQRLQNIRIAAKSKTQYYIDQFNREFPEAATTKPSSEPSTKSKAQGTSSKKPQPKLSSRAVSVNPLNWIYSLDFSGLKHTPFLKNRVSYHPIWLGIAWLGPFLVWIMIHLDWDTAMLYLLPSLPIGIILVNSLRPLMKEGLFHLYAEAHCYIVLINTLFLWLSGPNFGLIAGIQLLFFLVLFFGFLISMDYKNQKEELEKAKEGQAKAINPNEMFSKLGVDPIALLVGNDLLVIADPDQAGPLLPKIAGLRGTLTKELGYIIPNIRVLDSLSIGPNEFTLSIRDAQVAKGNIYPGRYMLPASSFEKLNLTPPDSAIKDKENVYGEEDVYWLLPLEIPEDLQKAATEATDVLINHVKETLIKHVDQVLLRQDAIKYSELVRQQEPSIIQELIPELLTFSDIQKVLVNLIREKVSIRDILFIYDRLCDFARFSKDPDILSEKLREALKRQICFQHADSENKLIALCFSNEWEKRLDEAYQPEKSDTFWLNPLQVEELIVATENELSRIRKAYNREPVILCSPRIRLSLFRLLERHIPKITILSYKGLIPEINMEFVGKIHDDKPDHFGYS